MIKFIDMFSGIGGFREGLTRAGGFECVGHSEIYNPPAGYAWQVVALVGEEIAGGTEIPDVPSVPEPKYYSAAWTAPAQSASGSFDLTFTVNTDKYQLNTLEKVDGAVITVTPSRTGGSVDGGSWQMTPAAAQTITTSGHTQDDSFHLNGGDGSATWTVHYEVSKTSTSTHSGQEGPFASQAEADAAAEAAKNAAIGQLQNEAQGMVDAAIAAARAQLANITFSYDEVTIPHGFDATPGALGSHQTITVPANSSNDYKMQNDEWSVKVSIDKIDSETKQRIKGNAETINCFSTAIPLFYNAKKQALSRYGVTYILKKYAAKASPVLEPQNISPHVLRHTKAMHLLRAGVNMIYIRDFLGHKEETNNVSNPIRAAGQRTEYRALLLKNIEYPILAQNNPMDTMRLDELVELMLDVVCSKRAAIRISGEEMPAEVVKSTVRCRQSAMGCWCFSLLWAL